MTGNLVDLVKDMAGIDWLHRLEVEAVAQAEHLGQDCCVPLTSPSRGEFEVLTTLSF